MDSDVHNHYDDDTNNHSSTFDEQDFSEHPDYYDDLNSHDTTTSYLSFPEEITTLPCSSPQQPKDSCSFSLLPPAESVNHDQTRK